MKLICELMDEEIVKPLIVEEAGVKNLYIVGTYIQAGIKNRNRRIYSPEIMENAVNTYRTDKIDTKRAFGELNHPASPQVNLERASHLITELTRSGTDYMGKAKVLGTPMGNIARGILEGGGQLGVSSRGVGTLKKNGMIMEVQDDFRLSTAADIVSDPSAPNAFVDAIMETCDWVFNEGVGWEAVRIAETVKKTLDHKASTLTESARMKAFQLFIDRVQGVRLS